MPKTFFGKIIAALGGIFGSVIRGAKKTFEQLTPEQKAALLHGSGIMALITQELDKTPAQIREAILEKFPDLDAAKLEDGLFQIAHAFNLAPEENNLEDVIEKLQKYLRSLEGNIWDGIVHAAAGLLSIIVAPAGTKFASIALLLEYVYRTFIKKHKDE